MKKCLYEKPEVTIKEFEAMDVITTSFNDIEPGDNDISWGE